MSLEDALDAIKRAGQMTMTRRGNIVTLLRIGRIVGAAALLSFTDSRPYSDPYKILQNYYLDQNTGGFNADLIERVRRGEARIEGDISNSLDVLRNLPFASISERLGLAYRGRVVILYPGAGLHYAMLDVGRGLAERVPPLSADFIFTEYVESRESYDLFPQRFREYMVLIPQYIRIVGEHETLYLDKGKETTFMLDAFGHRMTLMYAINMSLDGIDHSYFKRQYAEDSDILVSHDSFEEGLPVAIEKFCLWAALADAERQRAIIFEDFARVTEGKNDPEIYTRLPGEVLLVEGDYGCPKPRRSYK